MYSDLLAREDTRLDEREVESWLESGVWRKVRLDTCLWDAASHRPDHVATVDLDEAGRSVTRRTYSQYADLTRRIAGGLASLGVGAGDTVAVMLPNRSESGASILATSSLGATYTGIPTAYGVREAVFMLRETNAKVLIVQDAFRNRDYVTFAAEVKRECPLLRNVVVLSSTERERAFEDASFLTFTELASAPPRAPEPVGDIGLLAHVGFTSGTTGEPKGVMNTHQTLDVVVRGWIDHLGEDVLDEDVVNLIASPIGHHTGFLWGVILTAYLRGTAVFLPRWTASGAASCIQAEKVTAMVGAAPFLQDLVNLELPSSSWESLRIVSIPGAPVPRGLVPKARKALSCFICPAWGMTEWGIGISARPSLPTLKVDATDGDRVPPCDLRIVDSDGRTVPDGQIGNLQIRGPGLFIGYLSRPQYTRAAFQAGWFETGDLARLEEDCFSIAGRTKDVIIRGGENIPAIDVENLLYEHPEVQDAAVVGVPDERLGERAVAFVVARGAAGLTLEEVCDFLLSHGMSKHYLPEGLQLIDALPRTMSGKVRKVELRETFVEDGSRRPPSHQ